MGEQELVWVLAWPEGWSSLHGGGCAHPGPSLAAIGGLREGEQVQSQPSTVQGQGGGMNEPQPQRDGGLGARGAAAPALPGRAGGSALGRPGKSPSRVSAWPRGLLRGSGHPSIPIHRPSSTGARAAGPRRSGCSSNGFIPAEAGSKAGSDLDGFLLNNGEGARSLLLLARKTRVFQSIGFWE